MPFYSFFLLTILIFRNSLATLTMFSVPTSLQNAKCGDSMTVDIGKWLGIPGLPHSVSFIDIFWLLTMKTWM